MKKHFVILSLLICLSIPCHAQSQYFTGNGGKGMSLAILVPESQGLSNDLAYLSAMVQGVLVSNISKYSGISVLDRVSLDKVIAETLDPTYTDNLDIVRLGHVAQTSHIMTGKLIKTSSGYNMQINVTDTTPGAKTTASYSDACTVAQLDDHTAIKKASLELLTQMGVRLTDLAKKELNTASSTQAVNAQTALAQGITAQKQGTEVAALSYYFQAAAFDPSLLEAVNRSSVLAANISSGSIGDDARNDVLWRKNWMERLAETEKWYNSFFDNFFKTLTPMPYSLFYHSDIKQIGEIDYKNETMNLSGIQTILQPSLSWALSIEPTLQSVQKSVQAVQDGLNATGRKAVWGLDKWPQQGAFNNKPFGKQVQNFSIIVELVNGNNKVIGKETFQTGGSYEIPVPLPGNAMRVQISADERKTLNFSKVNVNDVTDNLTVRIASVNGTPAETAARNGVLQILTENEWFYANANMIRIQGGTFTMGSPSNEHGYTIGISETQHQVTVSSFSIGRYEVTQKEYKEVMGTNPSNFKGDNLPVEWVNWFEAIDYCNKKSQNEGLTPAYVRNGSKVTWNRGANGYRLPTEAEWEYACRAGTTTAYNTGAVINDNTGWYDTNSGGKTHPVGQKPANAWGLFDMHGNVYEWCWDWYGNYSSGSQTDPMGASLGVYRVVRGGTLYSPAGNLRSAFRKNIGPIARFDNLGFRLVRN
ncbi:formylglycine-generating enzyme family protein [Treponema sp. R80B11-R83G3]